jgi:uncharacterized membrane protein
MQRLNKIYLVLFSGMAFLFAGSCIKNHSFPPCNVQQTGPLYGAVKSLINNRCVGCHNPSDLNGGKDFSNDCNIISSHEDIKIQAVDLQTMPYGGPPLTASEKKIITDWITAGARFDK